MSMFITTGIGIYHFSAYQVSQPSFYNGGTSYLMNFGMRRTDLQIQRLKVPCISLPASCSKNVNVWPSSASQMHLTHLPALAGRTGSSGGTVRGPRGPQGP